MVRAVDEALRGATVVVPQRAAEALSANDDATSATDGRLGIDDHIFETLMVPFPMVVLDEIADGATQGVFAEEDHPVEALLLDGPHESLGPCVQIERPGRAPQGLASALLEHAGETPRCTCDRGR